MNKAKGCFITILVIFVLIIFGLLCVFVTDLNPIGKNILILGVDEREGNMGLNNTDTIIIYHISSLGEKDCLISIPRDTRSTSTIWACRPMSCAFPATRPSVPTSTK